jgi:hypothetical protein
VLSRRGKQFLSTEHQKQFLAFIVQGYPRLSPSDQKECIKLIRDLQLFEIADCTDCVRLGHREVFYLPEAFSSKQLSIVQQARALGGGDMLLLKEPIESQMRLFYEEKLNIKPALHSQLYCEYVFPAINRGRVEENMITSAIAQDVRDNYRTLAAEFSGAENSREKKEGVDPPGLFKTFGDWVRELRFVKVDGKSDCLFTASQCCSCDSSIFKEFSKQGFVHLPVAPFNDSKWQSFLKTVGMQVEPIRAVYRMLRRDEQLEPDRFTENYPFQFYYRENAISVLLDAPPPPPPPHPIKLFSSAWWTAQQGKMTQGEMLRLLVESAERPIEFETKTGAKRQSAFSKKLLKASGQLTKSAFFEDCDNEKVQKIPKAGSYCSLIEFDDLLSILGLIRQAKTPAADVGEGNAGPASVAARAAALVSPAELPRFDPVQLVMLRKLPLFETSDGKFVALDNIQDGTKHSTAFISSAFLEIAEGALSLDGQAYLKEPAYDRSQQQFKKEEFMYHFYEFDLGLSAAKYAELYVTQVFPQINKKGHEIKKGTIAKVAEDVRKNFSSYCTEDPALNFQSHVEQLKFVSVDGPNLLSVAECCSTESEVFRFCHEKELLHNLPREPYDGIEWQPFMKRIKLRTDEIDELTRLFDSIIIDGGYESSSNNAADSAAVKKHLVATDRRRLLKLLVKSWCETGPASQEALEQALGRLDQGAGREHAFKVGAKDSAIKNLRKLPLFEAACVEGTDGQFYPLDGSNRKWVALLPDSFVGKSLVLQDLSAHEGDGEVDSEKRGYLQEPDQGTALYWFYRNVLKLEQALYSSLYVDHVFEQINQSNSSSEADETTKACAKDIRDNFEESINYCEQYTHTLVCLAGVDQHLLWYPAHPWH